VSYSTDVLTEPTLAAYWRFSEAAAAGTVADSGPNGYTGTPSGVTQGATSLLASGDDKALSVAAGNAGVALANSSALNFERTQAWTVEFLVKPAITRSGSYSRAVLFSKLILNGGFEIALDYNGDAGDSKTHIELLMSNTWGSNFLVAGATTTDLTNGDTWYVAVTYDGSSTVAGVKFYVQKVGGSFVAEGVGNYADTLSASILTSNIIKIGARTNGLISQDLVLDEMAVYTSVLPQSAIKGHAMQATDSTAWASLTSFVPSTTPRLIIDTDVAIDIGDPMAIAVAHGLQTQGECNIIAWMTSTRDTDSPKCLAAFNYYYRRGSIPIGFDAANPNVASSDYVDTVVAGFPFTDNSPWNDPATLLRTKLAAAADGSVTLAVIGFTRNLAQLLASAADGIDSRNGVDLVAAKVRACFIMGGQYPTGTEYNFQNDPSSAHDVVTNFPSTVPLVFSGFEVGNTVIANNNFSAADVANPVRAAIVAYDTQYSTTKLTDGRNAWDQLIIMDAVRGFTENGRANYTTVKGTNAVNAGTGENTFTPGAGNHYYVVKVATDAVLAAAVNAVTLLQPAASTGKRMDNRFLCPR